MKTRANVDIPSVINQRKAYPVSSNLFDSELNYVADVLKTADDFALLVFPASVLNSSRRQTAELRQLLFKQWNVFGIFEIGDTFFPETSIRLFLLYLRQGQPSRVRFGEFKGRVSPSSASYRAYLAAIEQIIATDILPSSRSEFRFYEISGSEFDNSQLNPQFYDPELTENEQKIRREHWKVLTEIAEVKMPRRLDKPARTLSPRNFVYPFPTQIPIIEKSTDITLRQWDIVVSSLDVSKAFLILETPTDDVRSSPLTYVIRPRLDLISPYYLLLYLTSDTARKYAMRYRRGAVISRIDLQILRGFPIVIPSIQTQKQSQQLFQRLFLRKAEDPISEINEFLFTLHRLPQKAIQKEFILEVITNLQHEKKQLIGELLVSDFQEIHNCLNIGAHKSCLILCGSVLEAVLVDWLSEIEQKDYFDSNDRLMLGRLIEKLRGPLGDAYFKKAQRIAKGRNLIHPREVLKSTQRIDGATCRTVIADLKDVLKQRGLRRI